MGLKFTTHTDGQAVERIAAHIHHQIQVKGVNLARDLKWSRISPSDHRKRDASLKAAKNLYKGLCGDERPEWSGAAHA